MKSFGLPLMLLGGGGYTPRNVSRLWTYETSIATGVDLGYELPAQLDDTFRAFFGPDFKLHPKLNSNDRYDNKNSKKYLETVRQRIMEQLRYLTGAPSVQMQEVPPDLPGLQSDIVNGVERD